MSHSNPVLVLLCQGSESAQAPSTSPWPSLPVTRSKCAPSAGGLWTMDGQSPGACSCIQFACHSTQLGLWRSRCSLQDGGARFCCCHFLQHLPWSCITWPGDTLVLLRALWPGCDCKGTTSGLLWARESWLLGTLAAALAYMASHQQAKHHLPPSATKSSEAYVQQQSF